MTDFYLFRKVVVRFARITILRNGVFSPLFSKYTVCPFRPKQNVSTNKMINISKSLATSHFIDRTRTRFTK